MVLRFLHFADLHLGVEAYGRLDPGSGLNTRLLDFVQTMEHVFDLALARQVDLLVFAGDAYKNCDPSPTCQREFARQVHRLGQAGIPIVLVVGNHDTPTAFGRATAVDIFSALELDHTHVVRRPQLLRIATRSGPVQVAGLPWPTRHALLAHDEYKELGQAAQAETIQRICRAQIEEFARQLDPALPAILAAHVASAEATYSGSERTAVIGQDPALLTSTLANPAFDYVALGHVHRHQNLHRDAPPPVVYAGSVERVNFGEETDDKGCCLVHVEDNPGLGPRRRTTYEFAPTPARRFLTVQVEVRDDQPEPTAAILEALHAAPVAGAIVRVIYTVPRPDYPPVDHARVHAALAPAFCLAGIQRKTVPAQRLRRASIAEDLDLPQALDRYLENNPDLGAHRDLLQRYARQLQEELETAGRPEGGL